MKQKLYFLMTFFAGSVFYAAEAGREVTQPSEQAVNLGDKKLWNDYFSKHAERAGRAAKFIWNAAAGVHSGEYDQIDREPETINPGAVSNLKTTVRHVTFKEPLDDTFSNVKDNGPSDEAIKDALDVTPEAKTSINREVEVLAAKDMFKINTSGNPKIGSVVEKPDESKSWIQQFKDLFNVDLEPYSGDWDYEISKISSNDLATLSNNHTENRIQPCKLTLESHAKIVTIDSWLNSWTLFPMKSAMRMVFPIDDLSRLVSDLKTTGTIPADIGQRIENITGNIRLLPEGVKGAANAIAMSRVLSTSEALDYTAEVLPQLLSWVNTAKDIQIAQEIWNKYPNDHLKALREINKLALGTLKEFPAEKILKIIDDTVEKKTKTINKTKVINKIVTTLTVILFAISLGCVVLSIIEGVTENKAIRKIMEIFMIIDIAAIAGGIGYGAISLGKSLSASDASAPVSSNVSPVVSNDEELKI